MRAEFGLLGPLRVRSGAAELRILAVRQRTVLAALAVRARQAVSSGELAETIWGAAPPAKPQVAVRNYVSRHSELVPELAALTREQPLHERFRAQLMLALYRCGRQATRSYLRAISLWRDLGARYLHAETLSNLANTHRATGNIEAARDTWQQALDILADLDHPGAAEVRARLQDLGRAP